MTLDVYFGRQVVSAEAARDIVLPSSHEPPARATLDQTFTV
jgi:hypothetical protein